MGEPERRVESPNAADPDDSRLLERLRADPEAAIGEVLARFERPLLRYARAVVGNESAAQDVVQEAFIRLLRKTSSVRSLSAWLGRVTHNLAVDHLRRETRMKRLHAVASAEAERVIPPHRDPTPRELEVTLERELAGLSANERAVVVLKVIEGRSYKEISARTGLSTSNVGYLIHHGLKKLAARLAAAGALRGGGVMSCAAAQEKLVDEMLGEGSDADRASLAQHLRECPECAREAERIRRTIGLLRTHVPETETALEPMRRAAVVDAARRRDPWWSPIAVAASLIVLVAGVFYQAQKPVGPVAPPPPAQSLPTAEPFVPTSAPAVARDANESERQRQIEALREEVERLKADRAASSEPPRATGGEDLGRARGAEPQIPAAELRSRPGPPAPPSIASGAVPVPAPNAIEPRVAPSRGPLPPIIAPGAHLARPSTKTFVETLENPVSTFALDIDTASYPIARAYRLHDEVPPAGASRIDQFTRSMAPSYAAARGPAPFSLHVDGAPSPFHPGYHLLRIGVKAQDVEPRKPLMLTLVVDVSAERQRVMLVQQSISLLLSELRDDDQITIATSGRMPPVLLEPTRRDQTARIDAVVDRLHPQSSDAVSGLVTGYTVARRAFRADAVNRVVLWTDDDGGDRGRRNLDLLVAATKHLADEGIELLTLDVARRENQASALRTAAEKSGALYAHLDDFADARDLFRDLAPVLRGIVARDAKARVEFDPARVERYRLIGCEKRTAADHLLWRKEGDIYAGHILTAWYEVKLTTVGGDLGRVQIRAGGPAARAGEPALAMSESGVVPTFLESRDDFQFAAVVAHIAERLRDRASVKEPSLAAALAGANDLPAEVRRLPSVMEWTRLIQVQVDEARRAR